MNEDLEFIELQIAKLQREWQSVSPGSAPHLRLLRELSDWIGRKYDAEHAGHVPGVTGAHCSYRWLTSVNHRMADIVTLVPEVVQGKHIALTAADGAMYCPAGWAASAARGVFKILPDESREQSADWRVVISPVLESAGEALRAIHTNPACGFYNEWYVFDGPIPECDFEVFVSWVGYRLYDPLFEFLANRFWEQLKYLGAETYLAEGTVLTFATSNSDLFDAVIAALSNVPAPE